MPLGTRKLELARQYPAGAGQNTFDPQKPRSKIARASRRPRSILESSSESPPAVLCREKPSPRVPSGTEPRPGWRRLARPKGSQLSYWPPNSRAPDSKNYSAQRSLPARQRNLSQTQNMRLNDFATLGAARGAARHSNRAASTPSKDRRFCESRQAQPKARPRSPDDGRLSPKTTASKRRAADATPGGETQRSLSSLALPLASAEKQAQSNTAVSKASVLFSPHHKPRP